MAVIHNCVIESFMLSCRVLERGFELVLLNWIKSNISNSLSGIYHKTDKNCRYCDFYESYGVKVI